MWIYNVLNALFYFTYRLVELLRILWSILIIPFSILLAGMMNMNDVVAYSRYIIHQRINRLRTFSFTVTFTMNNDRPQLHLHDYDDDAQQVTDYLNKTKFPSIRACIAKSFQEASKYSYVIFQLNGENGKFIQLRMDTGVYIIDLPLTAGTLNRDYAIDFIKLLVAKGYTKTPPNTFYRDKTYSIEALDSNMTVIDANLGRDRGAAADFCNMVFTKIFKTNTIPEVVVG